MTVNSNDSTIMALAEESVLFHSTLQTRIRMIEFMKTNSTYTDFHEVRKIAETLKSRMIESIGLSKWLSGDEISEFVLQKINERVASIEIQHEFDHIDQNVTTLQKLNRDINHLHFSYPRKTGIHSMDTVSRLNDAIGAIKGASTPEAKNIINRIETNFGFGASYETQTKIATILAPMFYRPELNSEILKEWYRAKLCPTCFRLRYHLENLIDRNVSACDDFYHHVCSQQVDPNEFFLSRVFSVSSSFSQASDRLRPEALKNSTIDYDLAVARAYEYKPEDNRYAIIALERCKKDIKCYEDDQKYDVNHMQSWLERGIFCTFLSCKNVSSTVPDSSEFFFNFLKFFILSELANDSLEGSIRNHIIDTSAIINELMKLLNYSGDPSIISSHTVKFHDNLLTRIRMIDFMQSNSTYGDFHKIIDFADSMKIRMIQNIETTKWLHNRHPVFDSIREELKKRIASIQIHHDFDEIAKNITTLEKLNRDFNELCFANKRNTGVTAVDTMLGLIDACNLIVSKSSPETKLFIKRIMENFKFGAYFDITTMIATVLAPVMYRPAFHSDIFKEPLITYMILGHELYHSLFFPDFFLVDWYGRRNKCVIDHYAGACSKYAMGACESGKRTFEEDAADLESFRMLHGLMQDLYKPEDAKPIHGLATKLEQAFFIYTASDMCVKDKERTIEQAKDEHSAFNIRVNAALSLMPEFSRAFKCKEGDLMYIEEKDSCYFLGPNSH